MEVSVKRGLTVFKKMQCVPLGCCLAFQSHLKLLHITQLNNYFQAVITQGNHNEKMVKLKNHDTYNPQFF